MSVRLCYNRIMTKLRISLVAGCLCALLGGCSDSGHEGDDGWYENAKSLDRARESYVESQMEFGVSEAEAKRQFDRERYTAISEGRQFHGDQLGAQELDKDELMDLMAPQ